MKKILTICLMAMMCIGSYAQKKIHYEETEARSVGINATAYVKPMTVELRIMDVTPQDPSPKARKFTYNFSESDVAALGGYMNELKSKALYMACQDASANAIVGAMYHVTSIYNDYKKGCTIELTGYPAVFVNWHTATGQDYEWMRIDNTRASADLDYRARTKVSGTGVLVTKQ